MVLTVEKTFKLIIALVKRVLNAEYCDVLLGLVGFTTTLLFIFLIATKLTVIYKINKTAIIYCSKN